MPLNNSILKRQLIRLAVVAVIFGIAWFAREVPRGPGPVGGDRPQQRVPAENRQRVERLPEAEKPENGRSGEAKAKASETSSLVIPNLVLRDEDGETIYRGEIDLRPTLARIAADRKLRFSHDGSVFENRERRLPRKAAGYYREWVVPTPGERGPGPQRIVVGDEGEVWYTPDHYRSFRRIPYEWP